MAENRLNRELETREKTARKRSWVNPDLLPTPNPEEGYDFHWVRVSTRGEADPMNISMQLRQGWEPVKAEDHPECFIAAVDNDRYKDNIIVGGLMLCKAPKEIKEERTAHFEEKTQSQMVSVDNNYMRENDPRMPVFSERKSKVSFGSGS
jgi:hypothetical protein